MSIVRGTVISRTEVWDVATLSWISWDGSTTGGTGGGGADVQYVQDNPAVANPTGTALAVVRADSLVPLTSADGDIVAARGTNYGELYVRDYDAVVALQSINSQTSDVVSFTGSLNTKTPALGQATMANSSPVVLASDQSDIKIAHGALAQVTGTLHTDTLNDAITITGLANYGSVFARYQGNGGLGGPVGIQREATLDGTNWFAVGSLLVQGTQNGAITFGTRSGASTLYTTTDSWYEVIPVGYGITGVRYRVSNTIIAGSTATIRFAASATTLPFAVSANVVGTTLVSATQAGAGTNLGAWWTRIGDTTNGPVAVKAASTAAAATDPALVVRSIQLPAAVGQAAMSASLPVVLASDQSAVAVIGPLTDTQLRAAAVPVTANAGTNLNTSALALDATLTGRTAKAQITDGTRDGTVKAASTLPALTDTAVVTTQRDPLPAGTNVIGHVIADSGSTTAVTGTVTTDLSKVAGTAADVNSGTKSAGTLRVVLATDQPALTNKLLVTPDSVALPANQSVNVNQLAGTTPDTNSGVKSAGTLRVVLATDQPALTNKLLVTPDSVALPANQSVNVNQLAGTATDTNSGTKSAGTLRVVLATDQPALTNKLLVTPDSVALPANQSVNVAQFGGTNASTGTGASGAGIPRVTVANDSNVIVTPPTLTKGTQGATGFSTQDLKDSGRVNIMWTAEVAGAATTEGLLTVTESRDGAATTTFTSKVVTSGKRLRITSLQLALETLGSGTAPQRAYVRLRFNTAGAVTTSSPLQGTWMAVNNVAIVKSGANYAADFPDGIEFLGDGTKQIGVTIQFPDWVVTTATVQAKLTITAFEY